jgi:hypothetical protein
MRGLCTAEQKAVCPLVKCLGSDNHHLEYPAARSHTKVEKAWRELSFNQEQLPRCLHQAIHASGYLPERPSRAEMVQEIWAEEVPYRALEERMVQLAIGQAVLQHGERA